MEPYQRASQAIREGDAQPFNFLKNTVLAGIGGGAAGLAHKAIGKIAPAIGALISEYVPEKFSIEGLKKIDPRFGKMIKDSLDAGYTYDDFRQFMGDKIKGSEDSTKETNKKNLIEMYSPELHQFITQHIKSGKSHIQAGALAKLPGKQGDFNKVIQKIMKDNNATWEDVLESVYGGQQGNQQSQQPEMQEQQEQQQQPTQSGAGQQALMDIMNKINQRLGQ